jgi:NADPH:quinone reductase-like Zn-dependent oxidoreductase
VILRAVLFGSCGDREIRLLLYKPDPKDLLQMNELFEAGTAVPVIDRRFPLSEAPEAFGYYGSGNVKGKIVVTMATPA